jgi:hypothetical protein
MDRDPETFLLEIDAHPDRLFAVTCGVACDLRSEKGGSIEIDPRSCPSATSRRNQRASVAVVGPAGSVLDQERASPEEVPTQTRYPRGGI